MLIQDKHHSIMCNIFGTLTSDLTVKSTTVPCSPGLTHCPTAERTGRLIAEGRKTSEMPDQTWHLLNSTNSNQNYSTNPSTDSAQAKTRN